MDRLELQHLLWLEILGGRLYVAPLDQINLTHVLDVGTGTGSTSPTTRARARTHARTKKA